MRLPENCTLSIDLDIGIRSMERCRFDLQIVARRPEMNRACIFQLHVRVGEGQVREIGVDDQALRVLQVAVDGNFTIGVAVSIESDPSAERSSGKDPGRYF